jgi:Skp family chaperone for outer membrane proteins
VATDTREILDKVAALPMSSWNYKAQGTGVRHLGPTAQDFHAAFGLGESERAIATVDADGVALAAIQGLNQKLTEELKQKATEITELKQQLDEIKTMLRALAEKKGTPP